jgi:hypothetical protein
VYLNWVARVAWGFGVVDLAMLLKLCIGLKALVAPICSTGISTSVGLSTLGLLESRLRLLLRLLILSLLIDLFKVGIEGRLAQVWQRQGLEVRISGWEKGDLRIRVIREGTTNASNGRACITTPTAGEVIVVLL